MRKYLLVIVLICLVGMNTTSAQDLFLKQDARVDSLVLLHQKINEMDSLVPGYRVQIFFESGNYSKNMAIQTATEFSELYPDIRYYLSFNEPYYRIRVGDFRTLIEAKGFLDEILKVYPAAFEVKDKIYFPSL